MNGKWIVNTKGGPLKRSFEIAIVREDNEHGLRSYGWFHPNEKRLVTHNGGPNQIPISKSVWFGCVGVAYAEAARLNAKEGKL